MVEPGWNDGCEASARNLERDLIEASRLLPPHALRGLRDEPKKPCAVYVNRTISWGPSHAPVRGRGCCYHPGKDWLIENGLSSSKHMCVEVNDGPGYRKSCDLWEPGGLMLHELSHAYHHRMIPDGYENAEIVKCYERAVEEGLYDSVPYHSSATAELVETTTTNATTTRRFVVERTTSIARRGYAATNPMEYFAELSVAFLGGLDGSVEFNKWYPFNRKQLREHDPRAHDLLARLWKVDVDDAAAVDEKIETEIDALPREEEKEGSEEGGGGGGV